jgi:PucR family transcriptional regulator, purine catabolism regulatory protein
MAPTLASLVGHEALGLTVAAGADLLDRPLTWVHVSELPDPTPYLDGGELLLTLGLQIAGDDDAISAYVQRLAAAGISALGVGIGFAFPAVPDSLLDASERYGLPVLQIPRPVPFIAIAKTVFAEIVAEENDAAAAVFRSQQRLVSASLSPRGPADVVTRLAHELSGWALLAGPDGTALHATAAHAAEVENELAAAIVRLRARGVHSSASFSVGVTSVVVQSLGARATVRGFLAVGVARPVRVPDHSVISTAASLLTLVLEQSREQEEERRRLAAVAYGLVRQHGVAAAQPLARELGWPWPQDQIRVAVVTGPEPRLGDVAVALGRQPEPVLTGESPSVAGPHLMALAPAEVDLAEVIRLVTADLAACAAGVSRPHPIAQLRAAEKEAIAVLGRATESSGRVGEFDVLARGGLMALLGPPAVPVASAMLAPLVEHDARHGAALTRSVAIWLAHHGQWQPAADALGVHRHTVRQRIRAAESVLGRSLDDARTRMELLLAFEVTEGTDS